MKAPRRRPQVPPESRISSYSRLRELMNGYNWPFDTEPAIDAGPTDEDFARAWEQVRREQPFVMKVPNDPEGDAAIYAQIRFRRRVQHARLRT